MSMNLHCKQVDLWQTPTWVTHICLMRSDGKYHFEPETIDDAKRALYIYLEWASSLGPKVAHNDEEYAEMQDFSRTYHEHRQDVIKAMENPKLEVFMI